MKKFLLPVVLLLSLQSAIGQEQKAAKSELPGIDMVYVKGGKFDLGDDSEAMDRRPAHTVMLKDFTIGKYEVTEEQWVAVMGKNPSSYTYCNTCPVTNVSFNDAIAFINKLNTLTGKHYRLPTEAEWEFAARGGVLENKTHMKKHAGKRLLQTIAWYEGNAKDHPHPTGHKKANELGICDMTGNVEEWCNDWYSKDYFTHKDVSNPQGPDGGISKVVRGGSWNSEAQDVSVTRRAAYLPDAKSIYLGFRLAE